MYLDDIRRRLGGPFVPFKVRTADGRVFSVPHPEQAWVPPSTRMVVLIDPDGYMVTVQGPDIAGIEDEATASTV